jgi:hypothetical protein
MLVILMLIHSSMGFGWFHLSRIFFLFCASVLIGLLLQHVQDLFYIFSIFHNIFVINPITLHFSLQAPHSYKIPPISSSIRLSLNISHANTQTYDLLIMVVGSLGIFQHNSNSHIRTKNYFSYTSNSARNVGANKFMLDNAHTHNSRK